MEIDHNYSVRVQFEIVYIQFFIFAIMLAIENEFVIAAKTTALHNPHAFSATKSILLVVWTV